MTAIQLSAILGVVLALALSYIPTFGTWFAVQPSPTKVLITGVGLLVVAGASFGLVCAGVTLPGVTLVCTKADALALVNVLISALIANQGAYLVFVRPFPRNNPA